MGESLKEVWKLGIIGVTKRFPLPWSAPTEVYNSNGFTGIPYLCGFLWRYQPVVCREKPTRLKIKLVWQSFGHAMKNEVQSVLVWVFESLMIFQR